MTGHRILLITKNDFRQQRDGGSKRTAAIVAALEARGHIVDWVAVKPFRHSTSVPPRRRLHLKAHAAVGLALVRWASLSALKWWSPRAVTHIAALSGQYCYDAVVIDHSQLGFLDCIAPIGVRCISTHNVESELLTNYALSGPTAFRGTLARFEAARMLRAERSFIHRFDVVVTVSGRDARVMVAERTDFRARIVVSANGVDEAFFRADGSRNSDVVFVGHLGWRPNVDAATWLVREVWPRVRQHDRQIQLRLVGRTPSSSVRRLSSSAVTIHGDVATVIPYVAEARVATAPLLSAGGTRIKILEALAAGTPVVATSLGALGLEHLVGDHFVIADAPQDFARAVLSLARRESPREDIRALVDGYRWSASMAPFVNELETTISASTR